MSIIVYTSILGGFDNLRPPLVPPEPGVRFICFTDVPVLPDVAPWEFRPIHRVFDELPHDDGIGACLEVNSSRTSRLPKILPHLVLPEDADYSIWIDGNFQLAKPASAIINTELRFEDWAAHRHPARGCVYEEGALLQREKELHPAEWPSMEAAALDHELMRYRNMGYPEGLSNLTANGMIIRRHTEEVKLVCEEWWRLFALGCGRDQLSGPVAFSSRGMPSVKVNRMPHYPDVYASPLMRFGWHAAWKDKEPNPQYRPERERIAARVKRLEEVVGHGGYDFRIYK